MFNPTDKAQPYSCSVGSSLASEQLFGTASQAEIYFLLEYNSPWGSKAFEESSLPEAVKSRLSILVKDLAAAKLQLIKTRSSLRESGVSFFIVMASEVRPLLYQFQLDSYEDLLAFDFPAILSGDHEYQAFRSEKPFFLVCTNGRRDVCCARLGTPVYLELLRLAGERVWQSTHVGGHRFAANVLCFPYGLLYGRVEIGDVEPLLDSYRRGQLDLDHYRGRTCFPEVVQAAEYHLRFRTEILGFDAFRLMSTQDNGAGEWEIRFRSLETREIHWLRIQIEIPTTKIYQSCKPDKLSPLVNYHLTGYEILDD